MLNLLDDQLLDDVVSRAEQSRFSYTLQTEEFRQLNSNLQIYLNDIKIIDDDNRQLQENINQIRTDYIITLENHLKRLPEDFRQESHILTDAHIERYKSKSRAKRFLNEREELKKRIHFVVNHEKDQIKRLNYLQKQEHFVQNEFENLNEQIQNLYHYVQIEKQTHQQAMNKVDQLQIQLEQICIERSKTEFEIQTLREEVKLMETAKEFLDEEHQTILSTQTEANEYFLSRLNDSIARIHEDFNNLNKTQLKQMENEYKQMINILEENSLSNQTMDETMINQQRTIQIEYEKVQDEYQSIQQELLTLNDHNQILSERILNMESDLYSMRDQRIRELINKDKEFERNQIELQTLNEQLNHLVEYDRNLKFELTLYRGVLESEYRRKQQQQQQQQQLNNNLQPIRPTTLRTTTPIRSNKHSSILTNRNQLESIVEKMINQIEDEKIQVKEELNTIQEQQKTPTGMSKSPSSTVPTDQLAFTISPMNQETILASDESPPDLDHQTSSETPIVSASSTDQTLPEDQPASSDIHQSPTPSSEVQALLESPPMNEESSLTGASPVPPEDQQTPTDTQKLSSVPPSVDSEIPSEAQASSTALPVSEDQLESSDAQELFTNPPADEQIPSETEKSSTSINSAPPTDLSSSTLPDNNQIASDVQQSSNMSSDEQPIPPESSNTPSQEDQTISSDIQQEAAIPSQEQPTSSETQQPSSVATDEHPITASVADDTPASPTQEVDSENQLAEGSDGYDNLAEHEETTNISTHETDEVENNRSQSAQSIDQTDHNESILEHDQPTTTTEEQISSSGQNLLEELSKQLLPDAVDADTDSIREVGSITSPKIEDKEFDDHNESNLEAVMQDLRYVYRSLINDNNLVEINDDFSDNLIDRLEFGDNLLRTSFDGLLRKYLIHPAKTESRSKTLDWIEFRDILFPIITGRYMEEHIRKLFHLFDINEKGFLSIQELTELFELLQVNNSTELAQNTRNQNGELNIDELIETIKRTDGINNNILSKEIKNKQWYNQHPIDEDSSISLVVPTVNSPSKISSGVILLSRIFKRVGSDFESKQLDSNKPILSMKLTNEFIHNNIHITNDDLQSFIELYFNKKQNSDRFITWIEFRDIFFPFVNNGMMSKDDITRWFSVLDANDSKTISREQILLLLRLSQVSNSEEIFNKIQEIYPTDNNSWTLAELIFALENIDETTTHFLSTNEQIASFDLDWFTKNKF